jgi:hypothetical protein
MYVTDQRVRLGEGVRSMVIGLEEATKPGLEFCGTH